MTTLALVTGGFDPLHSGHIAYFNAAKELCAGAAQWHQPSTPAERSLYHTAWGYTQLGLENRTWEFVRKFCFFFWKNSTASGVDKYFNRKYPDPGISADFRFRGPDPGYFFIIVFLIAAILKKVQR